MVYEVSEHPWPLPTRCQAVPSPPGCDSQKYLQTLPDIPMGATSSRVENHHSRHTIVETPQTLFSRDISKHDPPQALFSSAEVLRLHSGHAVCVLDMLGLDCRGLADLMLSIAVCFPRRVEKAPGGVVLGSPRPSFREAQLTSHE